MKFIKEKIIYYHFRKAIVIYKKIIFLSKHFWQNKIKRGIIDNFIKKSTKMTSEKKTKYRLRTRVPMRSFGMS